MSWAEIKKAVNSDLNVPLNHLLWINDLAIFGRNGYVFNSEKIVNELLNCDLLYKHNVACTEILCAYPEKITKVNLQGEIIDLILDNKKAFESIISNAESANVFLKNNEVHSKLAQRPKNVKRIVETDVAVNTIAEDKGFIKCLLESDNIVTIDKNGNTSYQNNCLILATAEQPDQLTGLQHFVNSMTPNKHAEFQNKAGKTLYNLTTPQTGKVKVVFHLAPVVFTNVYNASYKELYLYKL